ncbi:MAG: hypothetical protein QOK81_05300 [Nitrososphaeraceae archaeon]|nr:hypothetical protein [Nitrososphaeraceae archaeon]
MKSVRTLVTLHNIIIIRPFTNVFHRDITTAATDIFSSVMENS